MFVLVHPQHKAAIGTFDSKRAAAAYKGRHPEFGNAVIVPLYPESEACYLLGSRVHPTPVKKV
jgi:hypothetical protein